MEFCARQTGVICFLLIIIFMSNYAKGTPTIVEGDIVKEENDVGVQTMSYVIRTNTWKSGQIPFNLDPSITKNRDILRNVTSAMYTIHQKTSNCIQFFPRTSSNMNYINITGSDSGCYSSVGQVGGGQVINVGPGCGIVGIIMHELLHALGFWHEHSRNDRDNYVDIKYENILPGEESNFDTRPDSTGVESAIKYDYLSLLHYKYNQFGKFRRDTIVPNAEHSDVDKTLLGQREKLSDKDIARIMWLYNCDRVPSPASSCAPPDFENVEVEPELYRYTVGTIVTFKCSKGTLIGAAHSECLSTGDWSGAKPFCVQATEFRYCDMEANCLDGPKAWYFPTIYQQVAKWKQVSGQTPTPNTGPNTDHTTQSGDGSYLLMEATDIPAKQTALALSPVLFFPERGLQVCIMFFYYMFGEDLDSTSTLSVYINWKQIWTRTGSTTEQNWYKGVGETNITSNYAFVFISATRGDKGDKADIAIDDVFLGHCAEVKKYSEVIDQAESKAKEYD
ncbi:uncharacterized protein LOC128548458 [Mercenaria mercenaria]|uniref:uncharacterized protein LOC128548458 n=1 Tax=Mercenaria mercenaria TaxID=6596 RepID=UPI00234E7ED3|nr:uncharacterized protein LOC128548458 [Mercenaria mercenaria]